MAEEEKTFQTIQLVSKADPNKYYYVKNKAANVENAEGETLENVEAGAQVNVIEKIVYRGQEIGVVGKSVTLPNDTYTKDEVDTELAKKANNATTLAGYGIADAYTKDEADGKFLVADDIEDKADKATTLAGYGITDAYTKTELDGKLSGAMHFKGTKAKVADLPAEGQEIGDMWNVESTGANYAWDGTQWDKLSENVDLSGLYTKEEADAKFADKATTLAGYGITNAYTKSEVDAELDKKADKATTLEGYGITDAFTKEEVNTELAKKADGATTLAGYGITDAYTKDEADEKFADKATTLAGYGITNAYTKSEVYTKGEVDTELAKKADNATTLAGYGITDAYTKAEVYTQDEADDLLDDKADKATTLAGYGIADAYTKTEVDGMISDLTFVICE